MVYIIAEVIKLDKKVVDENSYVKLQKDLYILQKWSNEWLLFL